MSFVHKQLHCKTKVSPEDHVSGSTPKMFWYQQPFDSYLCLLVHKSTKSSTYIVLNDMSLFITYKFLDNFKYSYFSKTFLCTNSVFRLMWIVFCATYSYFSNLYYFRPTTMKVKQQQFLMSNYNVNNYISIQTATPNDEYQEWWHKKKTSLHNLMWLQLILWPLREKKGEGNIQFSEEFDLNFLPSPT